MIYHSASGVGLKSSQFSFDSYALQLNRRNALVSLPLIYKFSVYFTTMTSVIMLELIDDEEKLLFLKELQRQVDPFLGRCPSGYGVVFCVGYTSTRRLDYKGACELCQSK